jgi:hypothetical protein
MRPTRLIALLAVVCGLTASASAQIRVAHWNICGMKGNAAAVQRVIAAMHADDKSGWAQPIDIITLNECTVSAKTLIQTAINAAAPTGVTYALATYTSASGEDSASGAQAMFYRSDRFTEVTALHQDIFTGASRYGDRWALQLTGYTDAKSRVYVYGTHLKASTGSSNEALRTTGMQALRANADALGAGVPVIFTGDMNFYSNAEGGYQALIAAGTAQAIDPYGTGNWTGAANAIKQTQAPAVSPTGGLVGGGLNDRFDFIVPSAAAADGAGIAMLSSTMRAVGNDGAHYNTDIGAGNNTYFPSNVARSNALAADLMIASDHIPQILEFTVPAKMSAQFAATLPTKAIRGIACPLTVNIQNAAPYVNSAGVNALSYAVACTGGVVGSASGTAALNPAVSTATVSLNTSVTGTIAGSVNVTSAGEAVENASISLPVSVQVIRPSNPSLDPTLDLDSASLSLDCEPDSGLATVDAGIRNVGYDASQSKLDIDSVSFSGANASKFSLTQGLGAGLTTGSRVLRFAFNTAGVTPGTYATTATVRTSDEAAAGEQVRNVTINLTVNVGSGLLGDLDGDGAVNFSDVSFLLLDFGDCSGTSPSDVDGSGCVDSGDVAFMLLLFT